MRPWKRRKRSTCPAFFAIFENSKALPVSLHMLTAILAVFIIGYLAIALEHPLHINKAASALLIGVLCWTLYALSIDQLLPAEKIPAWFSAKAGGEHAEHLNLEYMLEGQLGHSLNEIAPILFFGNESNSSEKNDYLALDC